MTATSISSSSAWQKTRRVDPSIPSSAADLFRRLDPLGFEAGDANLYRYVHDSSVNATDASGLQKEDTLAHRDPETPGEKVETLKKNKFDFHGGEGTVNVYTDATVSAKGKVSSDNNIWLEFIVKGSKEKNPVKDAHWLQFVESYKIRKNGEEGSGSDTVAGRYHKYGYGEWYVDTISKDKTKPFYDQPEKAAKRRIAFMRCRDPSDMTINIGRRYASCPCQNRR